MPDESVTLAQLRDKVQNFVDERDWRKFHTPKNLVMSLAIETAELMEHFQWVDAVQSVDRGQEPSRREAISEEVADVCCYLLSLVNALDLDLSDAIQKKLIKNAKKYPADEFRGRFEREP